MSFCNNFSKFILLFLFQTSHEAPMSPSKSEPGSAKKRKTNEEPEDLQNKKRKIDVSNVMSSDSDDDICVIENNVHPAAGEPSSSKQKPPDDDDDCFIVDEDDDVCMIGEVINN